MKKTFKLLLAAVLFSTFTITYVNAAECSTEAMNKYTSLADKVQVTNEFKKEEDNSGFVLDDGSKPIVRVDNITIKNLTDDMYVVVSEEITNSQQTYNYSDTTNGTITIKQYNVLDVLKYTFEIYTSDKTGCGGTKLKVRYLTTQAFNPYFESMMCDNLKDYTYCQEYVSSALTEDEFNDKIENYKNQTEKKEQEEKGILAFLNKHKIELLIIISLLVIGGTTTVIVMKKKGRR